MGYCGDSLVDTHQRKQLNMIFGFGSWKPNRVTTISISKENNYIVWFEKMKTWRYDRNMLKGYIYMYIYIYVYIYIMGLKQIKQLGV